MRSHLETPTDAVLYIINAINFQQDLIWNFADVQLTIAIDEFFNGQNCTLSRILLQWNVQTLKLVFLFPISSSYEYVHYEYGSKYARKI